MRNMMLALGAIAFALVFASPMAEAAKGKAKPGPAPAAESAPVKRAPGVTTLGCKVGKEMWDASKGACVPKAAGKAKAAPKKK